MHEDAPGFAGELDPWPTKPALAAIFRAAGYQLHEGRYSIRLDDFQHFEFRELDGDPGPGAITAENPSAEALTAFARRVSTTLANAGIKHRFEVYSPDDDLIAYLHHDWPQDGQVSART